MAMTVQVAWLACLALLQAMHGLASIPGASYGAPEILVLDRVLNALDDPLSGRNGTLRESLAGTPGLVAKAVDGVGVILDTLEAVQGEDISEGSLTSTPHGRGKRAKRQSFPYQTSTQPGFYQVQPPTNPQPYPPGNPQTNPQPYLPGNPQTNPQPYPPGYPQTRPQPYPPVDPRIYQRPPCPMPRPLSTENRWEYLKRIVSVQNQCRMASPCRSCPGRERQKPCVFDFDTLMTRLALLEGKLRKMAKLEARLKIHVSLLLSIQGNPNFPGVPGAKGHAGEKGEKGLKGYAGFAGSSGNCFTRHVDDARHGPPGPPGNKGEPGQAGPKVCGCDGDRGEAGERGEDVQGPRGRRGRKGDKGPKGPSTRPSG
ncbi:collagen alpha-2(IX) chain-like [Penaeus chinensis]|uniref:collagen alpha-2(IX) chain-like n=1 Tax=Penaeus chinensis TaxID=139456 RepID=UPI001FB58AE2|nr:collagen alpha-2(IX) chain-like [Penaeus chinensis]